MSTEKYEAGPVDSPAEEAAESPEVEAQEENADHEAIDSYLESLSPSECQYLFDKLKAQLEDGQANQKMSMEDIAAGK